MIVHDSWWSNGSVRSTIIDYHEPFDQCFELPLLEDNVSAPIKSLLKSELWKLCTMGLLNNKQQIPSFSNIQSRSQRLQSFWSEGGDRDLRPGPTPEVRDSRTSCHSAHAQSEVWQIWLVLVSIYCVHKAIQNPNVSGPGQGSQFPVHDKRDPWGRGWVIYR